MKIFAIDDCDTIASGYKYRYGAEAFTEYEPFLDALKQEKPDLLLVDLNIGNPEVTGWTIVDVARKLYPGIPIIIATAYDDDLQKAMAEFKDVEFWTKGGIEDLKTLRGLVQKYGILTRTDD